MKSKKQKYEEAVERNLSTAERKPDTGKPITKTRFGIKDEDSRYDARLLKLQMRQMGERVI